MTNLTFKSLPPEDQAYMTCYSRLLPYVKLMNSRYEIAKHHRLLANVLERVERDEIQRLIIMMPPRHGKSELATINFPSWYMGRHPYRQVITVSYNQDLANRFGRQVRNQLLSPRHQRVFSHGFGLMESKVSKDSSGSKAFAMTEGGMYAATGVGGPITGKGAHLAIVDDPIKNRQDAESTKVRSRLKEWYTSTLYTRLMPISQVVVIQTRWHDDDLAGWMVREQDHEKWQVVNLPAIAEEQDVLGRAPGEPLWPEWYSLERLNATRRTVGSYDWASLYQQRPTPREGGLLKREWFSERYRILPEFQMIIQSWDTASKDKIESDPSCCVTCGVKDGKLFIIHVWKEKVTYPELKRQAIQLAKTYNPHAVLIEDKSTGQALIPDMRADRNGQRYNIIGIEPTGDKYTRMYVHTPLIESGRFVLPDFAPWLQSYEDEMFSFPNATHDDQVDATSQLINYVHPKSAEATTQEIMRGAF